MQQTLFAPGDATHGVDDSAHEAYFTALLRRVPQVGTLQWIGVRARYREAVQALDRVEAQHQGVLAGDHARAGKRAVTLIQAEHLEVVQHLLAREALDPSVLRRNLVIGGINLAALKRARFSIGGVLFEGTGACDPCSRMEHALGAGGFNAMRGHGGITARSMRKKSSR
jgi:MOSC domain-containing protein YiiM